MSIHSQAWLDHRLMKAHRYLMSERTAVNPASLQRTIEDREQDRREFFRYVSHLSSVDIYHMLWSLVLSFFLVAEIPNPE